MTPWTAPEGMVPPEHLGETERTMRVPEGFARLVGFVPAPVWYWHGAGWAKEEGHDPVLRPCTEQGELL